VSIQPGGDARGTIVVLASSTLQHPRDIPTPVQVQVAVKFSWTFTRSTLLSDLGFGAHSFPQLCGIVNFPIHARVSLVRWFFQSWKK